MPVNFLPHTAAKSELRPLRERAAFGTALTLLQQLLLQAPMARRQTILQNEFPYSLTARSNNRDWFAIPMPVCWDIFQTQISRTSERYRIQTHCFVLMSNHFHWIASTPDSNIDAAMRYFMTETSRWLARASGRINKIYGT